MIHERVEASLKAANIPYRVICHGDLAVKIDTPADFARALGYEPNRIAKTLLVRSRKDRLFALVIAPAPSRIQLDVIAAAMRVSKLTFASKEEIAELLDYPPTGVSPLGAGVIPVFVEEELLRHQTILVGGGTVGVEVECAPIDLVRAVNATPIAVVATI
jgi:Cys-tRNA(Pro)/Cys-tRNA(Cys) deacylase